VNAPLLVTARDRSKFLGGSDAAAVLGVSPWATPVELWQQKTRRVDKEANVDPALIKMRERGHKLEPFIRDMVIDKLRSLGLLVELIAINVIYVDPEHDFLSCEIDFELRLTGTMEIGGVEIVFDGEHINCDAKSVTGFARKKWGEVDTEDVPIEYAAQFMHGLMLTGRRFCLVAALRSFDDVDIFWTLRDDETIAGMRPKLVSFWLDHVLADVPPDPLVFSDIKALFPRDNGLAIEATEDIAEKVVQYREIKARLKEFEEAEEALKFELGDFISPNTTLTYEGRVLMTWKGQNDPRLSQDRLAEAEIYRHNDKTGQFELIEDPVAEFTRTKVIRVLRIKKQKGQQ
jgi:predicted phage-related endonuclease